jgi:uncharacterized protein YbaA (DUF1428 family)
MSYIDGMICAVPTANRDAYLAYAREVNPIFKAHGAVALVDGWGDNVPHGKLTDFHRAVQATEDETVVFAWILWPDKAVRDAAWDKVMQDPRMTSAKMPFDGKRMIYGGFEGLLET